MTFSEKLTRLRKREGISQEALAEALGVTFAAVSKWERGVATPDLGLMAELASRHVIDHKVKQEKMTK